MTHFAGRINIKTVYSTLSLFSPSQWPSPFHLSSLPSITPNIHFLVHISVLLPRFAHLFSLPLLPTFHPPVFQRTLTFFSTPFYASSPSCPHISITSPLLISFYVLWDVSVHRCITTPDHDSDILMATQIQDQINGGGRASAYTYSPVTSIMDYLVPLIYETVTIESNDETVRRCTYLRSAIQRCNNPKHLPDNACE